MEKVTPTYEQWFKERQDWVVTRNFFSNVIASLDRKDGFVVDTRKFWCLYDSWYTVYLLQYPKPQTNADWNNFFTSLY